MKHTHLDKNDLKLLDALEDDVPEVPRLFSSLSSRLGIPEHDVQERLERMRDMGIVRADNPYEYRSAWHKARTKKGRINVLKNGNFLKKMTMLEKAMKAVRK